MIKPGDPVTDGDGTRGTVVRVEHIHREPGFSGPTEQVYVDWNTGPKVFSKEESIAFRKQWDADVERGKRTNWPKP